MRMGIQSTRSSLVAVKTGVRVAMGSDEKCSQEL